MTQPHRLGAGAPELSLLIPTRNEAENIDPLLARLAGALAGVELEILVVDDSDDRTPELVALAQRRDHRLRLLHRPPGSRQGGLSTAVVLGLSEARGRLSCVMDADLQHPPETVLAMLAAEAAGAELVVASRYSPGASRRGLGPGVRHLVSRAATLLARGLFDEARASSDPLSGFFLCRTSLLRGLEFRPVGFKILLELLVCSPGVRVEDVPLQFQARASGRSKASPGQGMLFLRHLLSLFRDVPGSARRWKFALVGVSGLLLFLALLELGAVGLGWATLAAWSVAFVLSALWTFGLNLHVTFADLVRERYPLRQRYVSSALTAGGAQLAVFLGLTGTSLAVVVDGLLAALAGMAINGLLNWQLLRRQSQPSSQPLGLERLLERLARASAADRGLVLDGGGTLLGAAGVSTVAPGTAARLALRAAGSGRPLVFTEPPSSRPQARASVGLESVMVLPLELAGQPGAVVVLQRLGRAGFSSADLEAAMRSLRRLAPRLSPAPPAPVGRQVEAGVT